MTKDLENLKCLSHSRNQLNMITVPVYTLVYFTFGTIKKLSTPQFRHELPFHVGPPI